MQSQPVGGVISSNKMAENEKVVSSSALANNGNEAGDFEQQHQRESVTPTTTISHDANNNSNDASGASSLSNEIKPSDRLKGDSSSSETDDWHLIEADDEVFSNNNSPTQSDIMKKMEFSNNNNNNNNSYQTEQTTTICDKQRVEDRWRKRYIEIDPLQNERQDYSPALIRLCISLYALIPIASLLALNLLIFLLFTSYWPVTLIYFSYLFLDRKTCNQGGRRINAVYNSKFWNYLAAYFPIKLRHSNEFKLDPNENYLLNYHPHGISAYGCVAAFATNGLNFRQLFPGLTSRFMVHETLYNVPVMRDIFSARGDCSVNSKSIDFVLSKGWRENKRGNLLALVGGGLAEADLSDARSLKIVLKTRKGFVKKALIHGANLIPCIAFGENSVFKKVNFRPGSFMHRFETQFYNLFKFKHPIYYGASMFSAKMAGSLPYKRPITVVMGDPIKVERVAEPSQEQIDILHAHYAKQVESLYQANRDLCDKYDKELLLV